MFNLNDRVKVFAGEHKGKEGIIINLSYSAKEIPTAVLKLDDSSTIKVDIIDL